MLALPLLYKTSRLSSLLGTVFGIMGCGLVVCLASVTSPVAFAAPGCEVLLGLAQVPFSEFDPEFVLRSHGIDPDKVELHTTDEAIEVALQFEGIALVYDGRHIGGIRVIPDHYDEDNEYYRVSEFGLLPEFRGKGLGTLLYLVAAKIIVNRLKGQFVSNRELSPAQWAFWSKMTDNGYALPSDAPDGMGSVFWAYRANEKAFDLASSISLSAFLTLHLRTTLNAWELLAKLKTDDLTEPGSR